MLSRAVLLRRVIVPLCVGVALTAAVSWVAMFVPWRANGYGPPALEDLGLAMSITPDGYAKFWTVSRGRDAWHTVVSYWHMNSSGLSIWMRDEDFEAGKYDVQQLPRHLRPEPMEELNPDSWVWYHETGWPMKAMTCSMHWLAPQARGAPRVHNVRGGVPTPPDGSGERRALPLTPLWPGSAVNVIFFASVWLLLTTGLGAARRRWRAKRGLCPFCRYSRTGLPQDSLCPECGRR